MTQQLAIEGGDKVRSQPMPYRRQFGQAELDMVTQVFHDSWQKGVDFGFQDIYERRYTEAFCTLQGGGYADAVSSGSVAIYLAIKALDLPPGSDVIVSPVTDPGCVSAILLQGFKLVIADSEPDSFNAGPEQFEKAITERTQAAVLTHLGGHPVEMDPIRQIASRHGIRLIEDCSQAHGALYQGKRVGRFGHIAAFSTMFSKSHASGGCGGLVYTENEELYWRVRSLADRGKPFHDPNYDPKNPCEFLFPSLNYNLDELSCAIGLSTLSRLEETISRRLEIAHLINEGLAQCKAVHPCSARPNQLPSLFFHTVQVDIDKLQCSKEEFARAIAAEGISINPHYRYVLAEWPWVRPYCVQAAQTPNAVSFRDRTFNILFHERYTEDDIADVIASIQKVERFLVEC